MLCTAAGPAAHTGWELYSGGSDKCLHTWSVPFSRTDSGCQRGCGCEKKEGACALSLSLFLPSSSHVFRRGRSTDAPRRSRPPADVLLHMLAKLVSFPTVPEEPHREDCRQASIYLKNTLRQLGAADARLLSGAPGKNPLVLATFRAQQPDGQPRKRVLFYGASSRLRERRARPTDRRKRADAANCPPRKATTTLSAPRAKIGRRRPGS